VLSALIPIFPAELIPGGIVGGRFVRREPSPMNLPLVVIVLEAVIVPRVLMELRTLKNPPIFTEPRVDRRPSCRVEPFMVVPNPCVFVKTAVLRMEDKDP
jgi:hypothetical protein